MFKSKVTESLAQNKEFKVHGRMAKYYNKCLTIYKSMWPFYIILYIIYNYFRRPIVLIASAIAMCGLSKHYLISDYLYMNL